MSLFKKSANRPEPVFSFGESLAVLVVILCILGYLIIVRKQEPQAPLFIAFTFLAIYGRLRGFSWDTVMDGMRSGLRAGVDPLVIFLSIGVLIATWIFSGTIPTIMYFGFKIISVKFFLPTVFIVCTLVGVACGSSFTTVSTMGIAFIGIGATLKINPGLTAGVIVSGAFCGSNISPLSGTTNLAASVGKISIYEHIKALMITDIPAWAICVVLYTMLGLNSKKVSLTAVHQMMHGLANGFWISGWAMLPVVLLIVLAILQVPAIPSLGLGSLFAAALGWIHAPATSISTITKTIMMGYVSHTGDKTIDTLLSKGGIASMLTSLALIIFALALGGLLIKFNIIGAIIDHLSKSIMTPGRLTTAVAVTCIGVNVLVGEHYLAIILPGQSFLKSFDQLGLKRKYLTRILNDAGAAVNAIIPWSVSGVFIAGALQIDPLKFIPWAFFPFLVTILAIITGAFLKPTEKPAAHTEAAAA
ncbi:Na+/H+ antiporter NhaC family protein [Limosilactobacillus sp.]|jgi:NhaC family Na+:H+ antiporter|uniref:Na+/H+ antiporter NhaC family protein n=1 Tax=Limosilactobacillus sp. TaxID=2773925 RepID=UPI0025BD8B23|nr:Na+/H+ antiporter NhaC family protein [Limosilactobacillus sp.]MCH3921645.1 sodium:proton antiporter [Limosilactobacillus sp.]MCH3928416.1 sodium:proton antiporter [Limosilactobacillus sp.]